MTTRVFSYAALLASLVAILLIAGCSGNSPVSPLAESVNPNHETATTSPLQIQLYGLVASIDVAERMFTLADHDMDIYAATDCEIATVCDGVITPVEFDAISIGDSVKVCGAEQEDGSLLANRIRIFVCSECPEYDLAFRSQIASIDYAGGTFTVADRPESIAVDENTEIWGMVEPGPSRVASPDHGSGFGDQYHGPNNITLEFTDLAIGDIVEVKANILDPDNLLAVKIKLAPCSFKTCVEFEAVLAEINVEDRTVTFEAMEWLGNVCPGAILTDSDGAELTITDYAPGDAVMVKGFEMEQNILNICLMVKTI